MNATAQIDKFGKIVVPKKLRDELNLVPGTKLVLDSRSEGPLIRTEAKPRGLCRKNGVLIYDEGPVPKKSVDWARQDREERMDQVSGVWKSR